MFDDSDSLVLEEDGTIARRAHWERDVYYFAYGNDYRGCIYDFYRLTGKTPLVLAGVSVTGGVAIKPIPSRNTLTL